MPPRRKSPSQNTALDRLKEGESYQPSFFDNEVGGELLNILSKGLYTNPLDAIREYVQNAIDADGDVVRIQVTGNSVFISDDGSGMTRDRLFQAKQFGVSLKSMDVNVGFRGIGIYSGFDLCNRLVIRTKTALEEVEHILVFKFGEMRKKLDIARQDPKRPGVPLSLLLGEGIYYYYEKSSRGNDAFTIIQLEDLSDDHITKLSDIEGMRKYILRNLPVRFSKDFQFAKQIENNLRKKIPGYKDATIILQIENSGPIAVEKPNIPDLDAPEMGFIRDSSNKPVAYYWACLTSGSEAIPTSKKELADFAGLTYKVKGFTIGDRNRLNAHFTRKQMYLWWTGEVYVITTQVIPTSARDDFEAGLARDSLETAVKNELRRLQRIALDAQAERRADKVVERIKQDLIEARARIETGDFDKYTVFAQLSTMRDDLEDQKNKTNNKRLASRIIKEIEALLDWIQKGLDQKVPGSTLKRKATKEAMKEQESGDAENKSDTRTTDNRQKPDIPIKLTDLVEKTGWPLDENSRALVTLLGELLETYLGPTTDTYKTLIEDIEAGLMDLLGTR